MAGPDLTGPVPDVAATDMSGPVPDMARGDRGLAPQRGA
jgi:hypothetical protein